MSRLFLAMGLLLPVLAFGQDAGAGQAGTVVKGRAPVAKELLKVRFPKPKSFTLSNGVEVYVLEDHRLPAVRFSLQMPAGSLYESKPGVAAATAAMLTEGTKTRTGLQIAEETENIGASVNANADLDTATVSASGLSESTDTLLALMSDVLMHPSFPTDRLERFRTQQRSGLAQRRTNPTTLIGEMMSQVFYGGTKYNRPSLTREDLAAITSADLTQFHDTFYQPKGAVLGITGDVNMRTLKAKLEAAFAGWKPTGAVTELPPASFVPRAKPHIYLIDRPGSAQTVLQFGVLGITAKDPDYIPLTIANRVLGGGSSGRLFQNIREKKGYTYGAYSTLTGGRWPGIWGANASVRTEVTEPAVGEFFYEFKRLQNEPVSEDELGRAKRSIVGSFARTLESPEGILGRTLEIVNNGLPMTYWDTYPARIQAVSAADVQRVARKYFSNGDRIQLLVVGERSKIEPGLAKYGTVEIVNPDKISSIGQ